MIVREPKGVSTENIVETLKTEGDNSPITVNQFIGSEGNQENVKQQRIEEWRKNVIPYSGYSYIRFKGEVGEYCQICFDNSDRRIAMVDFLGDLKCSNCGNISRKKPWFPTFRL